MIEVFVVAAVRTAVGAFGGSLCNKAPRELGAAVTHEAVGRAGVDPASIGHVVMGQVIATEPADHFIARTIAIDAGLPIEIPALTVNRLCGSGLQAIISAAQAILLGDCEVAIAGGAEVMSRAPFYAPAMRWGRKMGDATLVDGLNGALTDPFGHILMGVTAENVAERFGIDRASQDALAVESHRRAAAAIAAGRFTGQILPIPIRVRGKEILFDRDEHVRPDASLDDMARLKPLFKSKGGSVTAGNSSGINDGAAAVILASGAAVKAQGLTPLARLVSYGHAGVEPAIMGIGPVPASRNALARAGIGVGALDVIEANEAFAAQACAVSRELGFDPAKVNRNGSGISLGHPVGASGAIITTKLVHEMQRSGGRYGLATMCIGGGQGIAAIFERA